MPPRQTTSGNRPRRRPSPGSSGGWIWLILLGVVAAMLWMLMDNPPVLNNSDFYKLLAENQITDILVTPDYITGEIKDPDNLPEKLQYLKKDLRNGKKFTV